MIYLKIESKRKLIVQNSINVGLSNKIKFVDMFLLGVKLQNLLFKFSTKTNRSLMRCNFNLVEHIIKLKKFVTN